ncbi:MAG: hypothetical protein KAS01_03145 [Candidatus Pacebacteria bacterium]|nr:hypothetical protein [Candidatus Paceibacterota bacterium]
MRKITNTKLIISGNIIELFEYEKGFIYGPIENKSQGSTMSTNKNTNSMENRQRSMENAQRNLKRIINANAGHWKDNNENIYMPIFLTLTFKENITAVKEANYQFTKFKQRIDYEITKEKKSYLKYVGIIEFQKRGAVHYHVLFFNMPFIEMIYDKIEKIWGEGFIIVKPIKNIRSVASYVCKYMTKNKADQRLCGQKSYFSSKGLKKPIEILDKNRIKNLMKLIPDSVEFEDQFKSEYCGNIKYRRYNIAEHRNEKEILHNLLESHLV